MELMNKQIETYEKPKIREYKSSSKTLKGIIIGLIQKFSKDTEKGITYSPYELRKIFEEVLRRFNKIEEVGISRVNSWKGKSGIIKLIKHPNKIIVIRMQKPNKNSKPKEVRIEISREEINAVIVSLNQLADNQPIKTRDIAMIFSKVLGLEHPDWDRFFADRHYHNLLTNILDVMDKEKLIEYVGGLTKILKDKLEIQDILK